jgi:hypothetical protein
MDRRVFCFAVLACLFCGGLQAQTLTYSPLNPQDGDIVTFTVDIASCATSLDAALTLPGPGNGSIRLMLTEACACVATPAPIRLDENVGPLASGTYDVALYREYRDGNGPCCDGGLCAPPDLLLASTVAVSPDPTLLLLRQGRFRVRADWNAPGFGQGSAQAVSLTDESGYFTFFGPTNVELIAKVLNGCPVNERYWVFVAGMTNVGVTVHVEDTLTGHQETYTNPLGRVFQSVIDTSSFATCP